MATASSVDSFSHTAVDHLRTPPYSMEAEEAVIGGLLKDNEAWDQILDLIDEDDFFKKDHRIFFRAIKDLLDEHQPFDAITLADHLKDAGEASAKNLSYLLALSKDTPSAANIKAYAQIVHEKSIRRKLIAAANSIIEQTSQAGEDLTGEALLDKAEQKVFEIAELALDRHKNFVTLGKAGVDTFDRIDNLSKQDGYVTGLPTGYSEFDKKTSGLQKGDLIIIAGRPSMGKTSLAMNIVEYASIQKKDDGVIAVFSMEMPANQLALRFYASLARVDLMRLRQGELHDDEWPRLVAAMKIMQGMSVFIDDSSTLSPFQIRTRARRLMHEYKGLSLIVIDYLQLMRLDQQMSNRVVEVSEISRGLKALARELNVPVIALSQLNRGVEGRQDKRPLMSDLRESGAIEQDADLVVFIYRDQDKDAAKSTEAEIIVAKQRNGPQFKTVLTFRKEVTRFENHVSSAVYPNVTETSVAMEDII